MFFFVICRMKIKDIRTRFRSVIKITIDILQKVILVNKLIISLFSFQPSLPGAYLDMEIKQKVRSRTSSRTSKTSRGKKRINNFKIILSNDNNNSLIKLNLFRNFSSKELFYRIISFYVFMFILGIV